MLRPPGGRRRGLTLAEILVVVAILGVLSAVLLPAVQSAREAARATQCRSRIGQLALAATVYADTAGEYPRRSYATGEASDRWDWRGHSVQAQLLPYLERRPLFERLDQDRLAHLDDANAWAAFERVPAFLCPSDPPPTLDPGVGRLDPGCNLAFCLGTNVGFENDGIRLEPSDQNGAITNEVSVHPERMLDGSSNVLLLSEQIAAAHVVGAADDAADRAMYFYAPDAYPSGRPAALPEPEAIERWATYCSFSIEKARHVGRKWHRGLPGQTLFNTLLGPNSRHSNCSVHCADTCDPDGPGLYAARSRHPGAVHVGLCDGSVRGISDAIDLTTWHRLGARNDGQVVEAF